MWCFIWPERCNQRQGEGHICKSLDMLHSSQIGIKARERGRENERETDERLKGKRELLLFNKHSNSACSQRKYEMKNRGGCLGLKTKQRKYFFPFTKKPNLFSSLQCRPTLVPLPLFLMTSCYPASDGENICSGCCHRYSTQICGDTRSGFVFNISAHWHAI